MSTALVSSGFCDLFKDPKAHLKSILVDRKAVGSPLGYASLRRNSGSSTTLAMNLTNKLNNTTSICPNDTVPSNNSLILNGQQQGHRKLDRSFSEPVDRRNSLSAPAQQQQQQQQQPGGNSSRYKTELCRPFEENGTCKYGDKCQFAHGGHELRTLARHPKYKTELCRTFHTTGFCPYGPRCHFIHNADESRKSPPPPPMGGRPKALSIGGYSLGSAGDSPPSSLSESPTSMGSFFNNDDPFASNRFSSSSSPATPTTVTANTAFKYSQDFSTVFNVRQFQENYNHNQYTLMKLNQRNLNDSMDSVFRVASPPTVINAPEAPPSPVGSTASSAADLDSLGGTSPTCTSPLDVSKNLRLPIFSQLSISDD